MMYYYLLTFIIFGFLGWGVDTAYRSICNGKYDPGTYIKYFSPMYGFGAVVLYILYTHMESSLIMQLLVAMVLLTLLELVGGIFCERVLKKRVWDYSNNRLNFKGHIDALHSFYWLVLAAIVRMLF